MAGWMDGGCSWGYLVGADLGQLASGEVRGGLGGGGEATLNTRVQGDQRHQQVILTEGGGQREGQRKEERRTSKREREGAREEVFISSTCTTYWNIDVKELQQRQRRAVCL